MKHQPLDSRTYLKAQNACAAARAFGRDTIEHLHKAGLILTPRIRRDIQLQALNTYAQQLDLWRPAEFMRLVNRQGQPGTPDEMLTAVKLFVDRYIEHIAKEDL